MTESKQQDGRINNGGAREGAGRKPGAKNKNTLEQEFIKDKIFKHGAVVVNSKIYGSLTRIELLLDNLFSLAMSGNLDAMVSYLDIQYGRMPEKIELVNAELDKIISSNKQD